MKRSFLLVVLCTFAFVANAETVTGMGKTRTEACAQAKNLAGTTGECDCSKREKDDPLSELYPWVCSIDKK
jgi:hypothetical protein